MGREPRSATMRNHFTRSTFWLTTMPVTTGPGVADLPGPQGPADDEIRLAVEREEIKPLSESLKMIAGKMPGEMVSVEMDHKHSMWLYEFRVVGRNGRVFEIYVYANTGALASVKER